MWQRPTGPRAGVSVLTTAAAVDLSSCCFSCCNARLMQLWFLSQLCSPTALLTHSVALPLYCDVLSGCAVGASG